MASWEALQTVLLRALKLDAPPPDEAVLHALFHAVAHATKSHAALIQDLQHVLFSIRFLELKVHALSGFAAQL